MMHGAAALMYVLHRLQMPGGHLSAVSPCAVSSGRCHCGAAQRQQLAGGFVLVLLSTPLHTASTPPRYRAKAIVPMPACVAGLWRNQAPA